MTAKPKGSRSGIVPSPWEPVALGDLSDIRYGMGQPPEQADDGVPMIRATNVKRGLISARGLIRIKRSAISKSRDHYLVAGDVLVVRSGAYTGDVALVTEKWAGSVAGYDLVLSPKESLDPAFCVFSLLSDSVQRHFKGQSNRAAQPHLNRQQLESTTIPLPPLPEQKKIAHILSTVQRAIEEQERIIQTTTELKKALMHKLFTEGLRNQPQKRTEIGSVPESWEIVELGAYFQIKHGFAFDGQFFGSSGDFILMTPGNFHEEGGFRDRGDRTKYYTGEVPKDYILSKDDLVVAMTEQTSGLLGSAAFVPESGLYLHNQRLGLIADFDASHLSKRFLFAVFNHPHLREEVAKTSTGSKVKHTSPTKLRAVKVALPPTLKEQEEIAGALETTDCKISTAAARKCQFQGLFRTLLHDLMTARTVAEGRSFSPLNS